MISYILNADIDKDKYDKVVESAANTMIYAYSWYLNAVADNWDVLILNDYEAVMPLPVRKKYLLNYIYLSSWIQQLGIFSQLPITAELAGKFIGSIPKKFVLVDYNFNSKNNLRDKYVTPKSNYVLALEEDYGMIKQGFNVNRKRILKKDVGIFRIDKKGNAREFLDFYLATKKKINLPEDGIQKLKNLIDTKHSFIHIWNVYHNNDLKAGLLFLNDKKRITYLLPVANAEAKKINLPTFIVSELIKEYQNTNLLLDFEGSTAEGVARFYKSFGAEEEVYYHYRKRFLKARIL